MRKDTCEKGYAPEKYITPANRTNSMIIIKVKLSQTNAKIEKLWKWQGRGQALAMIAQYNAEDRIR